MQNVSALAFDSDTMIGVAAHPASTLDVRTQADELRHEYKAAFDNAAVGVMTVSRGVVLRCNLKCADIYGRDMRDVIGRRADMFVPASQARHGVSGEMQAWREDGEPIWIRGTEHALGMQDHDCRTLWIIEDITERKHVELAARRAEREWETRVVAKTRELELMNARLRQELAESNDAALRSWHAAHHDALTGLANRLLLNDRVEHALQLARRQKGTMALMYMDLDHFKHINDTLGHETGDHFLCAVAAKLRQSVRASDLVTRLGGDEFVILLHELHHDDDALLVARKILDALAQPIEIGGHRLQAAASIGISRFPEHGDNRETLMRLADIAMYRAKAGGRNGIRVFDATMTDAAGATDRQS